MNSNVESLLLLLRRTIANVSYSFNNLEWRELYDLSCKLGVCAIAFDGLQQLEDVDVEEELYFKWLGQGLVKESDFTRHVQIIKEFAGCCIEKGVKVFVLKGLSFGVNYPNPRHRPCGDIDVFCVTKERVPAYGIGNNIASSMGAVVDTHWYKHSQISYKGVLIENHEYLVCTREGKNFKKLNRHLTELILSDNEKRPLYDTGALIPSQYFNALFQAYHSCSHFLAEGIGIRHLLDWATFLQKEQNNIDWNDYYKDCERFHLKRFIVAMTDIAVHHLGIEVSNPMVETESPYADRLLNSILFDEDKVFGSSGGAWNHRLKLVRNAVKYRWKYKEIAQESYLKHIFLLIYGFFFHTED